MYILITKIKSVNYHIWMVRVRKKQIVFYFIYFRRIVSQKFMRKYVHVARDIKPQLTREAADFIADEYSKIRNQENLSQDKIARVSIILLHWLISK